MPKPAQNQQWSERQEEARVADRDIWEFGPVANWRDIQFPTALQLGETRISIFEHTGKPTFGRGLRVDEDVVHAMHEAERAARSWTHD